ncbi:ABC transporter substrate-binding protein [Mesorhizobium sp. BE184]|uniref:ABC transporter substrate-binding protein n=1 Tax=Mesorhizobium sp. BE184 TaxID=2817714 RepID=UPI0028556246|nr:ABC transporter substrate-binding protein [Mesorhizobium sp. BE184]MDR7033739.1 iron(III) transport system substrate-binding protein [Mesorhizobium sp. BE184]
MVLEGMARTWKSILLAGSAAALAALSVPAHADTFDIDALIEAAKKEPPVSVYSTTGKIVEQAKAFTAKYGVQATGTKANAAAQLEMVVREAQAKNVQADVLQISDVAAGVAQLVPEGYVESWVPSDLADKIDPIYQNPLVISNEANVWAYNTQTYDSCPIKNIWELSEPKWKGKVALQDPLGKASYVDWFNQMSMHADDKVAAAYKEQYGKDLETDEDNATSAWVKALAANGPLLTDADEAAAQAAGAPDQKEPFMGMMSSAKFRDNQEAGTKLGLCTGLKPFAGWMYPSLGFIAKGTDSPNAAKLFIHYLLTEEGIAPQAVDGKISTNKDARLPADEPSGIARVVDQMFPYDASSAGDDWDARQDWQDFWRVNYKK